MKASQKILVSVITSSVRLYRRVARVQTEHHDGDAIRLIVTFVLTLVAILVTVASRRSTVESAFPPRVSRIASLAATLVVLPILLFIAHEHHRLHTNRSTYHPPSDPNFYDEHNASKSKYQPRPMQELYYSQQGIYRTVQDDTQIFFRGINLPAKTPSQPWHLRSTANRTDFYESHRTVSFVDRPFPLAEAAEHFHRLSTLGFNLVRLSVSWEAVMHAGPGVIDTDYLHYLRRLVQIAGKYGLYVLIDPHQDVWSRFTGGDGAPGWTLEAAGFRLDGSLHEAGCAYLHQHLRVGEEQLPTMAWPTNYGRLATATMFTLFFAGDVYAPNITVPDSDGETIQQHLRRHYLTFINATADALKEEINVIGVETMNEPSNGFVAVEDLRDLAMPAPFLSAVSGFDSIRLGSGEAFDVEYYSSPFVFEETVRLNEEQKSCWLKDRDVWQKMGIYEIDKATGDRDLLKPNYFRRQNDDFLERFMVPFFEEIQQVVSSVNARLVTYASPHIDVMNPSTPSAPNALLNPHRRFGWAPHFYDAATLLLKSYSNWFALDIDYKLPVFTPTLISKSFARMLRSVRGTGRGKIHIIVGETGVPFDLTDNEENTKHSMSSSSLDRTINGMETNMLEYVLWNYMPHNTASQGDWWNGEDLSIRSNGNNRGTDAIARPHVYGIHGKGRVLAQSFDMLTSTYNLEVEIDCNKNTGGVPAEASFEVFLPHFHFPLTLMSITPKSGNAKINNTWQKQTIFWTVSDCYDGLTIT